MKNWLKIRSKRQKSCPSDKMERSHSHDFTDMGNTFCVLAEIVPCNERQVYTEQSLSSDHKKTILPLSEGANFHLEVHDFYLKCNYWLFKV